MASFDEVELFLKQLKEKLRYNSESIVFRPRGKNMDTLAMLDIVPSERNKIIMNLTPENYYAGPKNDNYDTSKPDYFEFGVVIKSIEIYIKISLGPMNKPVDCMSFHQSEFPIKYPLKKSKDERKN